MRIMAIPAGILSNAVLAVEIVWVTLWICIVNGAAVVMGTGSFIHSGLRWKTLFVVAVHADDLLCRVVEAWIAGIGGLVQNRRPEELRVRDRVGIVARGTLDRIKH